MRQVAAGPKWKNNSVHGADLPQELFAEACNSVGSCFLVAVLLLAQSVGRS